MRLPTLLLSYIAVNAILAAALPQEKETAVEATSFAVSQKYKHGRMSKKKQKGKDYNHQARSKPYNNGTNSVDSPGKSYKYPYAYPSIYPFPYPSQYPYSPLKYPMDYFASKYPVPYPTSYPYPSFPNPPTYLNPKSYPFAYPTQKPSSSSALKPSPTTASQKRPSSSSKPGYTKSPSVPGSNSPVNRKAWFGDFDVDTNMRTTWPNTGRVVVYNLEVSEVQMAPDGHTRTVLAINNQYPGPVIEANWGDTLEIFVTNNLPKDGTSFHWHGVHQMRTNSMDGTNGLTECPIAPGVTKRYRFLMTQYGTGWYHSHYSDQYGDGVVGTIKINGPATANYDIDLGTLPLTDWFHTPIEDLKKQLNNTAVQLVADNTLVNGTMVSPDGKGGRYSRTNMEPGKKHLLRLINTSSNQYFHVSLDGHPFTVIANDFVPIQPVVKNELVLGIGQRYDVIIGGGGQKVNNYWLRVGVGGTAGTPCDGPNRNPDNIRAIFSYRGASPDGLPTTRATQPLLTGCYEETGLVPYQVVNVPPGPSQTLLQSFSLTGVDENVVKWYIDKSSMVIDWDKPTLQYVEERDFTFPRSYNVYPIGRGLEWVYWVIQSDNSNPPLPHPIHLHGHDFSILAEGTGKFSSEVALKYDNPARRDTANLPARGYLVVAFQTDNPGAWLMHCHIAFHISGGFGFQFLERESDILPVIRSDLQELNEGCRSWTAWNRRFGDLQHDSGL